MAFDCRVWGSASWYTLQRSTRLNVLRYEEIQNGRVPKEPTACVEQKRSTTIHHLVPSQAVTPSHSNTSTLWFYREDGQGGWSPSTLPTDWQASAPRLLILAHADVAFSRVHRLSTLWCAKTSRRRGSLDNRHLERTMVLRVRSRVRSIVRPVRAPHRTFLQAPRRCIFRNCRLGHEN